MINVLNFNANQKKVLIFNICLRLTFEQMIIEDKL